MAENSLKGWTIPLGDTAIQPPRQDKVEQKATHLAQMVNQF
jgi:hypothetical protein